MGAWFGRDPKAYRKWSSSNRPGQTGRVGLTGAALERVVMGLATSHPGLVAIRS